MIKKFLTILFFIVLFNSLPVITFARDPYPNRTRIKSIVAPREVEDPYNTSVSTDPQTMITTEGKRAPIISFSCYYGGKKSEYYYLTDPAIDTMEKATAACNNIPEFKNYEDFKEVRKPYLKNNKNVSDGEEKYDINGYDWPIGNFLGRHPKASKGGWEWVTPLVYAASGGPLNACGADGKQKCDCDYVPYGPKETWIRITRNVSGTTEECVAPPYATSGPWWNWFVGEVNRIENTINKDELSAVGVFFGIDGEGRPFKSGEGWKADPGPNPDFNKYVSAVLAEVKKRYPGKTIRAHFTRDLAFFLENGIDIHWESLSADGSQEYIYKSNLNIFGYDQIYADNFYLTNTLGLNPDWPPYYYALINALSKHTDGITGFTNLYNSGLYQEGRGDFIKFAGSYIGRDINDTPGVWIYLRDTTHKKEGDNQTSGKYGDYMFYLYRPEDLVGNKTVPVLGKEVQQMAPATRTQIYSWENQVFGLNNVYVGRKNAPGNHFMSFDVDDGYRFTGRVSDYDIKIVYLDMGTDSLKFQYKNKDGQWQEKVIPKKGSNKWEEASFLITGAFFNNNASEGENANIYPTDFRIDTGGSTIIHSVEVRGRGQLNEEPRPKAQVSCEIVRNPQDDPKEGVYSVGLNQTIYVRAKLVDSNSNPLANERVMFTYNSEWNLAGSEKTDANGVSYYPLKTVNRSDSSGFLGAGRADWPTSYSVQVYYPGSRRYQPSRNDCVLLVTNSSGPNDALNTRMKILGIDTSAVEQTGKIRVNLQIIDNNGEVLGGSGTWEIGRANAFFSEDPNAQTIKLIWTDREHHATFNNITVYGTGKPYPTSSPLTPSPIPSDQIPSRPVDSCPNGTLGNLNCDSEALIDEIDLDILLNSWTSNNAALPTPKPGFKSADLNNDGKVDEADLEILLDNWKI